MLKAHLVVTFLRIFLVLLFAVLVLLQTMSLPGQFAHMAKESPDDAYLRWPLTAVRSRPGLLCVQVVIVCTWQLLTMVKDDRIFSEGPSCGSTRSSGRSAPPGWCCSACSSTSGSVADDPGLPLLLFLLLVGGAVLGLLMVVMRALLRQATTLRTDMEAVI